MAGDIEITEEMVETVAKSDAEFDGRTYEALGRADKQRYQVRAWKGLTLVSPLIAAEAREAAAQECDRIDADDFTGSNIASSCAAAIRSMEVE